MRVFNVGEGPVQKGFIAMDADSDGRVSIAEYCFSIAGDDSIGVDVREGCVLQMLQ